MVGRIKKIQKDIERKHFQRYSKLLLNIKTHSKSTLFIQYKKVKDHSYVFVQTSNILQQLKESCF